MQETSNRYYWLKLKRDFFKRHDVQIIEDIQPNGKEYVLFYLKLMVESIDHDGELRFSDTIPYNAQMLATITRTNIDVVRGALKALAELGMIEILSDQTIYMTAVEKMIGSAVDNDNANRQRRFRERQKQLALQERYDCVTKNNESKSIDIDKDIDTPPIIPPTGENDAVEKAKADTSFEVFWKAYPKKVGKQDAKKAFERAMKKNHLSVETLVTAIESQKHSEQWSRENGRFIPNPSTWLNQGRWEDELQEQQRKVYPKKTTDPSETHNYDMDELRRRAKE